MTTRVILAGATGLVGHCCVDLMLANPQFSELKLLSRRQLQQWRASRKITPIAADFAHLAQLTQDLSADFAICALGTTIRQAGSQQAFYAVDHDYVLNFANAVKAQGCRHFALVSAVGASPDSGVFYNRVKGETERDLAQLGFDGLYILRPSLLLGPRQDSRLFEGLGQRLMPKLSPLLPARYKPIRGQQVASKLVALAQSTPGGQQVYQGQSLFEPGAAPA